MKKGTMQLETLTCPSCIQKIEGAVKKMDPGRHFKNILQLQ